MPLDPSDEDALQEPYYTRDTPLEALKTDLWNLLKDLKYPYRSKYIYSDVGLPDEVSPDTRHHEIRADNSLSDHYEYFIVGVLERYFDGTDITVTSGRYREYPDVTLDLTDSDLPADLIAVDPKTVTRKDTEKNRVNRAALLRGDTDYFTSPSEKAQNITHPYDDYDRHWPILVLHSVNQDYDPQDPDDRISTDITVVIDDKWRLADDHMRTGSGSRNYVFAPYDTEQLLARDSPFNSRKEFESWCMARLREDPSTDY